MSHQHFKSFAGEVFQDRSGSPPTPCVPTCPEGCRATCGTSDKLAVHGMRHSLKPVMCAKLAVDVVQMVAECLQSDPKFACSFDRVLAF
jgi:hypothetical protein